MSGEASGRFRTWSDANASQVRIGDAEREGAVAALGEHYAAGRLTKDEYDERSTAAFEARTLTALQPLFADLPLPHGPLQRQTTPLSGAAPVPGMPWRQVARRGPRIPWFPVLVLAFLLAVATHFWVVFWLVVIGAWAFSRVRRDRWRAHAGGQAGAQSGAQPGAQSGAQTSGSCFGGRGTWR